MNAASSRTALVGSLTVCAIQRGCLALGLIARHPVANIAEFIPNDVELGGDRGHVMVLTGPNMGGKSTLLRQARARRLG